METKGKKVLIFTTSDMHPYNCDGMYSGRCEHCERKKFKGHNPENCALCNFFEDEQE